MIYLVMIQVQAEKRNYYAYSTGEEAYQAAVLWVDHLSEDFSESWEGGVLHLRQQCEIDGVNFQGAWKLQVKSQEETRPYALIQLQTLPLHKGQQGIFTSVQEQIDAIRLKAQQAKAEMVTWDDDLPF